MSKVVHILTDANIGGAGVWLKRTLQYIEKDFDITVLIPENSLLKDYLSTLTQCQIIEVPYIADRSLSLKGILALHKVLKKLQPEVVHTHASLSGRLAAKVIKNTWCLNSRHCIEPIDTRQFVRKLKNVVNGFLSDRIVAVSHGVYDNLVASGVPKDKLILIPNGVDPLVTYSEKQKDQIKADYGVTGKKVLGYVGRLESVKGPEYLLDIMTYMKSVGRDDVVLLAAGNGSMKAQLETDAKAKGIGRQIQWLGFVEETEPLYNIMDVCINTSRSEAISLTLLEAMSIGVPVVAFDVDGLDQVIIDGDNGYLIPPYDTKAYSEKLLELLDSRKMQTELGSKGASFVRERYSMTQMIEILKTTYKEKQVQ